MPTSSKWSLSFRFVLRNSVRITQIPHYVSCITQFIIHPNNNKVRVSIIKLPTGLCCVYAAYENDIAHELRTAAFIRGKLFTQTHSTQILQSGPFSPRHGTGAECINSTFMDCLLHAAGHQDCKQRIKHLDDRYRKKTLICHI